MSSPASPPAPPAAPAALLAGSWPLVALTAAAALVAAAMGATGRATWLEAASFVTGALCVWLTVRENIWNFPIGLVNVATFSVVFFQARLFGDAGLQVVYFVLGVLGWAMWLRRDPADQPALRITCAWRAGKAELLVIGLCVAAATLLLWRTLRHAGGSSSFFDALTTALSLGSQWLLNKKRLESWIGWIIADTIYVPLYLSKGLTLTALLYAVFLAMAIAGLRAWHRACDPPLPLTPPAAPANQAAP